MFYYSSKHKGQWFLIAIVVLSAILLIISIVFNQYFTADSSQVSKMDENLNFWDIYDNLNKTVQSTGFSDCNELKDKLDEFIYFSKQKMAEKGYYLFVNKSIDCAGQNAEFGMLLASDKAVVYKNIDPNDILPLIPD